MKNSRPFSSLPFLIVAPFALATASCAQTNNAPATQLAQAPKPPAKLEMEIPIADEAAFFDALNLDLPELAAVKAAVAAKDWDAAKVAWARHLETRTSPKWLWSRADKAKIMALLAQHGDDLSEHIAPADEVLARRFNPQGKVYQMKHEMTWILKGEDTHVVSRFTYFNDLGLAYWKTGDPKYATDFVTILKDWLAHNPAPTDLSGVIKDNTTWRTLEAGARIKQLFNDMQLFMDAPQFDAQTKYLMTKSLMEHARYLYDWAPTFHGGNWQVTEATGLATAGIMLPEAKQSKEWRDRGLARLTEHMQQDILPDGGHSELNPGYHANVMAQYVDIAQLAKANGIDASGLMSRHEKMYEWLQKLSQPDSIVPPIGDTHGALKIRGDMTTGALMYNRPDFKFLGAETGPASWVWLFGADAFDKYAAIPIQKPDYLSVLLPESHFMTMRSGWNVDDNYFLFDASPRSTGHSHASKLQVLAYAGRPLLIDPGIYAYGEPLSTSYFREPEAHNVVLIDGKGSPRVKGTDGNAKLSAWQSESGADFASGTTDFDGYRFQRSVVFVKPGYWVVVDNITSAANDGKPHEISRLFHFPISPPAKSENNIAETAFADGKNLQIQVADNGRLEMSKGWIAMGGATAKEAPEAIYKSSGPLPMTLVTVLTPFANANELPKVENLTGNGQTAHIRLNFPSGQRDEIMVSPQTANLKIGAQQKFARALIVRNGPQAMGAVALDGSVNANTVPVAAAPTGAKTFAKVTATSSGNGYPASNATDGDAATFWVSGSSKPGEGLSAQNPESLQFVFDEAKKVSAMKILGRAGYGPKSGAIQVSDDGKNFRTVKEFSIKDGVETVVQFAPTSAKEFRVMFTSAYDQNNPKAPRNVQVSEISLMAPDGKSV